MHKVLTDKKVYNNKSISNIQAFLKYALKEDGAQLLNHNIVSAMETNRKKLMVVQFQASQNKLSR